jgi:hypothetical protein
MAARTAVSSYFYASPTLDVNFRFCRRPWAQSASHA